MILVDTSVWIDHLRRCEPELQRLLVDAGVACHPFVIGELACGHLRRRAAFLQELRQLPTAPSASHDEALAFVERHALAGRGIGWGDMHLLAATVLSGGGTVLWTRDKALAAAAAQLGVLHRDRLH